MKELIQNSMAIEGLFSACNKAETFASPKPAPGAFLESAMFFMAVE